MCLVVTSAPLSCLGATAPPRCRARGCALQCEAPWRSAQAGHDLYLARISAKCDAVLSSVNLVSSFPSTGPQLDNTSLHCFMETSPDTTLNPPWPLLHAGAGLGSDYTNVWRLPAPGHPGHQRGPMMGLAWAGPGPSWLACTTTAAPMALRSAYPADIQTPNPSSVLRSPPASWLLCKPSARVPK